MTYDEWCTRWDRRPWRPITVDDVAMFRTHIDRLEAERDELRTQLDRLAAIAPQPAPYPWDDDSPAWRPPTVDEAVADFYKYPSAHTCREIGRALRRAGKTS